VLYERHLLSGDTPRTLTETGTATVTATGTATASASSTGSASSSVTGTGSGTTSGCATLGATRQTRSLAAPPSSFGALLLAPLSFLSSLFVRLFLPRGRLPPEYLIFQALDSLQALCSYLRGVLTLHATMEGLGVGGGGAALSATLALLLKEGSSHCSGLLFAFLAASRLDAEVRWWRLSADVANDVGLALELAAPLGGPRFFLPLTCAANACKAVCGVAAGATRVAISAHFAGGARGGGSAGAHVAEVAAKEGTQETAVTLLGLVLGFSLAPLLNASRSAQWASFAALTLVHVAANAAAVRCLALRTLSRTRASLLLRAVAAGAAPPSPTALRAEEPLYPVHFPCGGARRRGWEGGALRLGCPFAEVQRVGAAAGAGGAVAGWLDARAERLFEGPPEGALRDGGAAGDDWFLAACSGREGAVAFSNDARPATLLAGWAWAAARLHGHGCGEAARLALALLAEAGRAGWDVDACALDEEGFRVSTKP
jgi:hypothetical protein